MAETVPEDLTVRGAIKAAIDEVSEKTETEIEPKETPEVAPVAEAKPPRERDEQGKFAKAPRETLTLPKRAEAPLKPEGQTPIAPEIKAPDGWTQAAKAEFAKLPPLIQQEVTRREREAHQAISRQDQDRQFGQQLRQAINPYLAVINAENSNPVQAVSSLLNMAYVMRFGSPQQKQQLLLDTARLYNVPLGAQPPQPVAVPQVAALEQRLTQMEQRSRQAELSRQQLEDFGYRSEVEAFASEAGHEHFENVRQMMASFLESGAANDLQEAYEKATWASPDIRSSLISQDQAAKVQAARAKSEQARRASGSVIGAPGALHPIEAANGEDRTLRDELRANLRAATGRI